ncbi:MAG: EAL domain-containing protein [Gammaproteobacteria bacterium]|nr:EAL domain-containing protein [Gammaproteobacteria bacterium]MBU3998670.1 EAL domain-containing protein [Gammaproteobacteria bacterium]MBU4019482.1 EAL domain-containing protein [Gammaproteobacteria bacterium]MBU4079449.1 EAL domain-containing protein [Gammaproteobacteria bacterium]MBU4115132.1 EAL domain-containing protein [Gammaproteobacteria bacterium]
MRTVTAKLTSIYRVVALLVLLSSGLISQIYLYQHARSVAHKNLTTQAVAMAGNLESALVFSDVVFAQQTLQALQHYPNVRMAAVVLSDGKEFARYAPTGSAVEPDQLLTDAKQTGYVGLNQHGVAQTIAPQSKAPARLVLVASLEELNQETLLIFVASTGIGAVILLAALVLFRRLSRSVTASIESLTALMRAVEHDGTHGQRTDVVSDDEIGELARGFNAMLGALEAHNLHLNTEIDERKRTQDKLDQLAHYDTVTHLPNRRFFNERLKMAVQQSLQLDKIMAVLFVDLDNFKLVNDSFGHDIGDDQLRAVADRLSKALRASDVVCRLGGDEFAIILENLVDTQQIEPIVEKMIQSLIQPLRLDNHDLVVTGSVGVAVCPDDADNPEGLLRFADAAMYAAKAAGKNTWRRFDPDMASRTTLRLTLESQMRAGMETGQFEVHYQPQIDLATGEVVGMEALARWNHPESGYISPVQFIPVAEECGLIRPLGGWVLRSACQQIAAWSRGGHEGLKVAVNVSVRQLLHDSFADEVLAILMETGCPAQQLELEITESVLMQNGGKTLALLERLRQCGIGIAIDDFGTGYSSMAQLKNMPVTKLKIDKSFVDDITTDADDRAITAAMAGLAHNLRIQVIAEGVETNAQVERLRQAGCHNFQGYYFARPMQATQVPAFIANFQRQQGLQAKSAREPGAQLEAVISQWGAWI